MTEDVNYYRLEADSMLTVYAQLYERRNRLMHEISKMQEKIKKYQEIVMETETDMSERELRLAGLMAEAYRKEVN